MITKDAPPIIQIEGLVKCFKQQMALDGINLKIPAGKIVTVVGSDGTGKTTLLRLMAALLRPTEGKIEVMGCNTVSQADKIHELLGYMPQRFGLYEDLTVMQNLVLYAELNSVLGMEREKAFEKLLNFTGLKLFTRRLAGDLSGGMKQKLGLACTLIRKPQLLLLDEPTVGVDPISRRELWKIVSELVEEGISVVWSTTYLEEAEKSDHVLLLHEGKLLLEGPPPPHLEKKFISLLGGLPKGPSKLAERTPEIPGGGEYVIEAEGLTKQFGTFTAVDHVSFRVKKGEVFGLLGPNGAGKSTTFKMLCGLLKITSGKATIYQENLLEAPANAREHIGYMAQKFSLYSGMSVMQNLEFFSGVYQLRGKEQKVAIDEMLEVFELGTFAETNASDLGLGYKQRLALACAVMHHPKVLFLDEPTSGVDPITRFEFWNHINGLVKKGTTIIVTTHFMNEAEHCDRLGLIFQGKLIAIGTPESLKKKVRSKKLPHPTLEDAFISLCENHGP